MTAKIIRLFKNSGAKIMALSLVILGGVSIFGTNALAAVDPDVTATTGLVVTTMKENITGVITANIASIVIVGVIIFSIGFVWKLTRRFMK
ncbi:MAG: hypothetical protein Q7T50_07290 [Candidatus Magasanikbacteria bacterium]|nr:hypothetical protein [Candidatus Magasanikbacteria bacterium]